MDPIEEIVKAEAAIKFTKLEIETDGTGTNTKIKVNGEEIKDLSEFCFNFYTYYCSPGCVSMNYTTREKQVKPGMLGIQTSYRLNTPPEPIASADASAVKAEASVKPVELAIVRIKSDSEKLAGNRFNVFR